MSNRFHTKWHRRNHHTYGNSQNPDASFDPIASPAQPFLGDFSLQGALCAVAPLSSYAAYLYTNNMALCAFAGQVGIYVNAPVGVKIQSSNIGLSSVGNNIAGVFYSPILALSAVAGQVGGYVNAPVGIQIQSSNIGLSSVGNNIAGVFYSPTIALSTVQPFGDGYPNRLTPYVGPNYISKNVFNNRVGIFTENPLSAFHVTGGSYFDGHSNITGNLSVNGDLSRFDTNVLITSSTQIILQNNVSQSPALLVSNTGQNYVLQILSPSNYPALIVDGNSSRPGWVGVGTLLPNNPLTVVGTISGSQRLQIGYNVTASGLYSSVAGGQSNNASGLASNVAGGDGNNASGCYSNVAGGHGNNASGQASHVAGGYSNTASGPVSNVAGGLGNNASGCYSNVAGGQSNNPSGCYSNVAGGLNNNASGCYSNVAGGQSNNASGQASNVAGGCTNTASGGYSSILGGRNNNTNNQTDSFILGSNLKAFLPNYTYTNNISAAGYSCNQYSVTDSSFNNRISTNGNDKTLAVQSNTTVSGYVSLQNLFNGVSASTDLSIFNNNNAYVDLGINSTGYNGSLYSSVFTIASANDAYLFSNATANNLAIGTANISDLVFFTGGTLSGVRVNGGNEALRIKSSGKVGLGVSDPSEVLTVFGNISGNGAITSTKGFTAGDRFNSTNYSVFYRANDKTKLYDSVYGDVLYYDTLGQVGIGGSPTTGKKLSVTGDVFFTGEINGTLASSSNFNSSANTTIAWPGLSAFNTFVSLNSSSNYEIAFNVIYTTSAGGQATFALSGNNAFTGSGFIAHSNAGGMPVNANNGSFNGTTFATLTSLLSLPKPILSTGGTVQGANINFYVQTGLNPTIVNLTIWNSTAGSIFIKQGSYWKKTNLN